MRKTLTRNCSIKAADLAQKSEAKMGPLKILLLLPVVLASATDSEYLGSFQRVYPTTLSHYQSFSAGQSHASASAAASASAYSSTGSSYARSSAAASASANSNNQYYHQQSGGRQIDQQHGGSRRYNTGAGYGGGHHTGMRSLDTAASKGQNSGLVLDQSLRNFYERGSSGQGQVVGHEGRVWRQEVVQNKQAKGLQAGGYSEFTGRTTGPRGYQQPTRPSYQQQPTRSSYQQHPTRSSYQHQPTRSSYQHQPTRSSYQQQSIGSSYSQHSTGLSNQQRSRSSSHQRDNAGYSGQSVDASGDIPQFAESGRSFQQSRGLEQSSVYRQSMGRNNFQQLNVMKGQPKATGSVGNPRFTGANWQQSEETGDNLLQITETHSPLPTVPSHYPAPNPTVGPTLQPNYIYRQRIVEQRHDGQRNSKGSTCFYISCYSNRK